MTKLQLLRLELKLKNLPKVCFASDFSLKQSFSYTVSILTGEEILIKISSDPVLKDSDRCQLFCKIQETWHIYGNFCNFISYTAFMHKFSR